ncbi:hypothetical protein ACOSQ3_004851 [Xanthoceras sorbifolium]
MVDAVVSYVVERLGDFLIEEAAFLGVKNDVEYWLKRELGWMQCFLKDAEEKQHGKCFDKQVGIRHQRTCLRY